MALGWHVRPSTPNGPCPLRTAAEWAAPDSQIPVDAFTDEKSPAKSIAGTELGSNLTEGTGTSRTRPGPGADSPSTEAVVLYLIYKRDPKIIIINYPGAGEQGQVLPGLAHALLPL